MKKLILLTGTSFDYNQLARLHDYRVTVIPSFDSNDELAEALKDAYVYVQGGDEYLTTTAAETAQHLSCYIFFGVQPLAEDGALSYIKLQGASAMAIGENANAVAEHTIGLVFALLRELKAEIRETECDRWNHHEGRELAGKTVGILGTGRIGSMVAEKLHALGAKLLCWSRQPRQNLIEKYGATYVALPQLLEESQIVTIHLALARETRGLLGLDKLKLMQPGSYLVNTARVEIVDMATLAEVLQTGQLGGAASDVWPVEGGLFDTASESGRDPHGLLKLPNFILTHHDAFNTRESNAATSREIVDHILSHCPA